MKPELVFGHVHGGKVPLSLHAVNSRRCGRTNAGKATGASAITIVATGELLEAHAAEAEAKDRKDCKDNKDSKDEKPCSVLAVLEVLVVLAVLEPGEFLYPFSSPSSSNPLGSTHTRPSRATMKWAASGPQVPAG